MSQKQIRTACTPIFAVITLAVFAVLTSSQPTQAQTSSAPDASQPTVLYGAAYYHEYTPDDRLDKDVALMKDAGFTVVRMGESTWRDSTAHIRFTT